MDSSRSLCYPEENGRSIWKDTHLLVLNTLRIMKCCPILHEKSLIYALANSKTATTLFKAPINDGAGKMVTSLNNSQRKG